MNNELKDEIVIYRTKDGKAALEVNLSGETLWLNQGQVSILFDRDRSVSTKHLSNIFKSGELDKKSNVQKMHIAGSDCHDLRSGAESHQQRHHHQGHREPDQQGKYPMPIKLAMESEGGNQYVLLHGNGNRYA